MTNNDTTKIDRNKSCDSISCENCKKNFTKSEPSASLFIRVKLFWLVVSLCILTIISCTTGVAKIYPAYEGQRRPVGEVAQVFASAFVVAITEIDGKEISLKNDFWAGPPKVELLPGDHTIKVVVGEDMQSSLVFTVEANQRYELTRWGNNAVLTRWIDRWNTPFVAPVPGPNDVIVQSPNYGMHGVNLLSVDGDKRSSPVYGFAIRLAPGLHTFILSCKDIGGFFKSTVESEGGGVRISGGLEAGYIYIVEPRIDRDSGMWSPILVKDALSSTH